MTTIPMTRNTGTMYLLFLSNLNAVGSSSMSEMYTIMPAIMPKDIPYTSGPKWSLRTSHPRTAAVEERTGWNGRKGLNHSTRRELIIMHFLMTKKAEVAYLSCSCTQMQFERLIHTCLKLFDVH